MTTIYTIGFTKKSLQEFIETLRAAGVRKVIDVRLRNTSQLAGWSKQPDFAYLLQTGFGLGYEHHPEFAPTDKLLDQYKSDHAWEAYEQAFNDLLAARQPAASIAEDGNCLLCAEPTAKKCHRRMVAEYLQQFDSALQIKHL